MIPIRLKESQVLATQAFTTTSISAVLPGISEGKLGIDLSWGAFSVLCLTLPAPLGVLRRAWLWCGLSSLLEKSRSKCNHRIGGPGRILLASAQQHHEQLARHVASTPCKSHTACLPAASDKNAGGPSMVPLEQNVLCIRM